MLSSSSPHVEEEAGQRQALPLLWLRFHILMREFTLWCRWERVRFSLCSLDAVPHPRCLLRALHHQLSFRRLFRQALLLRQPRPLIQLTGRLITATTCAQVTWQICLIRSDSHVPGAHLWTVQCMLSLWSLASMFLLLRKETPCTPWTPARDTSSGIPISFNQCRSHLYLAEILTH